MYCAQARFSLQLRSNGGSLPTVISFPAIRVAFHCSSQRIPSRTSCLRGPALGDLLYWEGCPKNPPIVLHDLAENNATTMARPGVLGHYMREANMSSYKNAWRELESRLSFLSSCLLVIPLSIFTLGGYSRHHGSIYRGFSHSICICGSSRCCLVVRAMWRDRVYWIYFV
jgi:hypothetical protein